MDDASRGDASALWAEIAAETFGIDAISASALPGDCEQNVMLRGRDGTGYVLKAFVSGLPRATIEFQRDVIDHAVRRSPALAAVLPRFLGQGDRIARVSLPTGTVDAVLLPMLSGTPLAEVSPHSPGLLRGIGQVLGELGDALADFEGSAAPAPPASGPSWALVDGPAEITPRLEFIEPGDHRRDLVARIRDRALVALDGAHGLPESVIHQDANEWNLLVDPRPGAMRISGLIDFGDAGRSFRVCDPAIAAAYASFGKRDPLGAMAHVVAGYHGALALEDEELAIVYDLALLRIATSVAISSERAAKGDASEYHLISQRPGWGSLERLADVHPRFAAAEFRRAAGKPPLERTGRFQAWAAGRGFAPVLGASLASAPRVDLSVDSPLLTEGARDLTLREWGAKLEGLRAASSAIATVGYHDEARLLYGTEAFSEPREDVDEPRTVHLGVDLFAPAGTEVMAPLAGTVLSVARNSAPLDYGPTLILQHEGEAGLPFWTLYGHLDGEILERLGPGDPVEAGAIVGRFGAEHENGGWPPHLHFQVILDRLDLSGDFPGVAAPSRRETWTALSPDPAPLLGLDTCAAEEPRTDDLLDERHAGFCRSMSISYDEPIQMVKGRGTTLFDAEGRAFLDAVNNVPHVGHCHPRVVEAGQRQMALLNTNTRYLNRTLHRYAEKLRARLPEGLDVIYFVSSGSEANEVALRLAKAASGGRPDVLVQESGYHGHTGGTVSRSHYKFSRQGGFTPPDEVHVVPLPDSIRGLHRGEGAGPRYVAEVEAVIARLVAEGRPPGAMLAEAIIGCGGQVVPPPGYLAGAFDAVRAAGGITIADEVQVGFGRVGTHFWAFEEQGAVPDIVTMGKPIGNGHPLAAVATTRAIADAFAGGMEFFATFGGNPVSAAIGEAVLDVIEDEGLMANAARLGQLFHELMGPIAKAHPLIDDVRGRGLYLGVDLVKDPETGEPATEAAHYVCNRMRDHGILISTDGPHGNVLKIKPPIVFSEAELRRLVETLGRVLDETAVRGRSTDDR